MTSIPRVKPIVVQRQAKSPQKVNIDKDKESKKAKYSCAGTGGSHLSRDHAPDKTALVSIAQKEYYECF